MAGGREESITAERAEAPTTAQRPPGRAWLPRFLRRPGGVFGAGWLLLLALLSAAAPLWRPYGPDAQNLTARLQGPGRSHWLGTDDLGRDILTRIFTASGPALLAAALSVAVAFAIGIPLVLAAAEYGHRVERLTSRCAEVMMALPATIILLALIGAVGGGDTYLIMAALGVLMSAVVYRTLLGVAQGLHRRLYVDAARVDGAGPARIGIRYVLPGMATVTAVQASQLFAASILVQSGLAFMGFGPAEPTPSWGGMIATASQYVYQDPWMMVPAGVVLALTVIAANMLGDALAASPQDQGRKRRRQRASRAPSPPLRPLMPPATLSGAPLLKVTDLSLGLTGGPPVVTSLTVSLEAGRVLGLVGESGCGKTLTALALLGLLPPEVSPASGSIRFEGRELVGLSERQLRPLRGRELAMIPQDPMVALDPLFTVGFQLAEQFRRFRRVGRKEATRMAIAQLERVGIADPARVLRARPYELSGGMAQRVTIALALTGEPRLLIADEPTTALDVTVQAEILDLLRRLVEETGVTVIIVSHDMGVIADICDEVAVMYAGHIVEKGPVAAVLEDPQHPYTTALLAANPHLAADQPVPERLVTIPGQVPAPGSWPAGCRFAPRCLFAEEQCQAPIELAAEIAGTLVRCRRAKELHEHRRTIQRGPG
jgi:peptide/nickel transport system permease protein